MAYIKQSGTYTKTFLMVSATDHISPLLGATVTVTISKAGGAFAAPGGAVSEIGSGWYKIALTTADTGTLGDLDAHATATGGDPTDFQDQVVAFDPQSATSLGLSNLDAAVSSRLPTASYVVAPSANVVADALLDRVDAVEAGLSVRFALRLILAALAGKVTVSGSTVTFRDADDTKNRIVATTDANGQRTTVTLNGA